MSRTKTIHAEALQAAQHIVNRYGVKASEVGRLADCIAISIRYAIIAQRPGLVALERDRRRLEYLAQIAETTPDRLRAEIDISMAAEADAAKRSNRRGRKAKA